MTNPVIPDQLNLVIQDALNAKDDAEIASSTKQTTAAALLVTQQKASADVAAAQAAATASVNAAQAADDSAGSDLATKVATLNAKRLAVEAVEDGYFVVGGTLPAPAPTP